MTTEAGAFDLWRNSAAAETAEARDLATLLELRARDPDQAAGRFLGGQTHLFVWGTRL